MAYWRMDSAPQVSPSGGEPAGARLSVATERMAEIVGFYHPAVWWVFHVIRKEREDCCDDLAVSVTGEVRIYTMALARLADLNLVADHSLAMISSGGELQRRIQRQLLGVKPSKSLSGWISFFAVLIVASAIILPASGSGEREASDVTAAKLVNEVRAGEKWVFSSDSFQLRVEITSLCTAKGKANAHKTFPMLHPDASNTTTSKSTVEFAFDSTRFRAVTEELGRRLLIRVWDGTLYSKRDKYLETGRETYTLDDQYWAGAVRDVFDGLSWPRSLPRDLFWWNRGSDPKRWVSATPSSAEEFVIANRTEYRGVDCHVVEWHPKSIRDRREGYFHRWYVGADDRRLYGLVYPFGEGMIEFFMYDYREVAPSCWLPFAQGRELYETNSNAERILHARRDVSVREVQINEELPDGFFRKIEFIDKRGKTEMPPVARKYLLVREVDGSTPRVSKPPHDRLWGPSLNGLQAAAEFHPPADSYRLGSNVPVRFYIRNVDDKSISFTAPPGIDRTIEAEHHEIGNYGTYSYSGITRYSRITLQPGQEVEVPGGSVAFAAGAGNKFTYPTDLVFTAQPGTYVFQYELEILGVEDLHGYEYVGDPPQDDWNGTLKTASVPVVIGE